MAVVSQNQADQEQQNQNSQSGTTPSTTQNSGGNGAGTTTVVSGSKGGASGAGSNAAPTVQSASGSQNSTPQTPSSSGSFTNLKSYLNANNNGQNFSNQINSNLNNQGQQLQSNVNSASNAFNQQAQGVVNPLQTAYSTFNQNGGSNGDANAITNYTNASTDNANSVKNLENASYTGPKSLNDLTGANNGAALQGNINNYSTLANSTTTEPGRFSLLQNMFGGQGYTQGQQTLDNVFINPSQISGSRSLANQTQNAYNQAANDASANGQNYTNQVAGMAQGTVGGLNNAVGSVGNQIQNQYSTNMSQQDAQLAAQQAALASGTIDQSLANNLGLTNGQNVWNANLGQYVSANTGYSAQDAATQAQYNQIAALGNLLGNNANTNSAGTLSQFANAPATQQGILNYDQSGLANAIGAASQSYNSQISPQVAALEQNAQGYNNWANPSGYNLMNGMLPFGNGTTFDPTTLTAAGGNTTWMGIPMSNSSIANNDIQQGENQINGAGGAGFQYANPTGNEAQSYINALSNLMSLNNSYDPTKQINVTPKATS